MKNDINLNLDLTDIPKELKLILKILNNNEIDTQYLNDVNWDIFYELIIHHRLYPVLFPKLKIIKDGVLPINLLTKLSRDYRRNTFQMLFLSGEMQQVGKIFNSSKIPLIVLKGPVLAADLYGELSLRTCGDLDVLVSRNHLNKVDILLRDQGYVKDDYIKTILNDWTWRHHHVTYIHPEKNIKLEVHWRLNPGPGIEPSFNTLWKRKRISSVSKEPIYYLGKEDLFIFLVSHGARHGWSRLRWLLDIHHFIQQEINWNEVKTLSKKYQIQPLIGQAMVLSSNIFKTKIDEIKAINLESKSINLAREAIFYLKEMVNLHSSPVPEEIFKYHRKHLFNLLSPYHRFLFVISFLYPYHDDYNTLPLPKFLHLFYFPLRPALWLWRKVT
jgi:Uncharacterised nucleotidyltransferase